MKLSNFLLSLCTVLLMSFSGVAQESETGSLDRGTIQSQYDFLYKKGQKWTNPANGRVWRSMRVINLNKFKNNVIDTLKQNRQKNLASQQTIAAQKTQIDSLNSQLASINTNLTAVTKEKDNISLIGIQMSKAGYNTILWSIIGLLAAALAFFISKFKKSNTVTVLANKDRTEIELEYEAHRQRALEREQKLRRELQDELNKQKYSSQAGAKKGNK